MTQTIRTAAGRNAVWIEADYGQGRRGRAEKAEWSKTKLEWFLNSYCETDEIPVHILRAFAKGYAYEASYGGETVYFASAKEARDWCWTRDC